MCVLLPIDVGDESLRDAYAPADINRLPLGPRGARVYVVRRRAI